jgi:hypothetical protein
MNIGARLRHARKRYPKGFREDYVVCNSDGAPETIFCVITGTTLQSTRKIGSVRMLAPTDAYAEIRMTFDDGSHHVSPVSKSALKTIDNDMLESIYCANLLQWHKEGADILDRWASRKPIRFEVLD